jgi:hypothetical protein
MGKSYSSIWAKEYNSKESASSNTARGLTLSYSSKNKPLFISSEGFSTLEKTP